MRVLVWAEDKPLPEHEKQMRALYPKGVEGQIATFLRENEDMVVTTATMQDPEQGIQRALAEYRALGYSENWINQRLKSIEIRKDLTDEWKKHGLKEGVQFATLTDIIYKTWAGKTAKEYKEYKGLKKENLRDNMTNKELVLNMLAELSTKEISESNDPKNFSDHVKNAVDGASIAKNARIELEQKT